MAVLTSRRCLPRHLPDPPTVAATRHSRLPMPGQTMEKGAHKGQGQAQRIIATGKASATLAVTDTIDRLASSLRAQVKGRVPWWACCGINVERAQHMDGQGQSRADQVWHPRAFTVPYDIACRPRLPLVCGASSTRPSMVLSG
jgi:hypothetical protein